MLTLHSVSVMIRFYFHRNGVRRQSFRVLRVGIPLAVSVEFRGVTVGHHVRRRLEVGGGLAALVRAGGVGALGLGPLVAGLLGAVVAVPHGCAEHLLAAAHVAREVEPLALGRGPAGVRVPRGREAGGERAQFGARAVQRARLAAAAGAVAVTAARAAAAARSTGRRAPPQPPQQRRLAHYLAVAPREPRRRVAQRVAGASRGRRRRRGRTGRDPGLL